MRYADAGGIEVGAGAGAGTGSGAGARFWKIGGERFGLVGGIEVMLRASRQRSLDCNE